MALTNTIKSIDKAIQNLPPLSEVKEEERQALLAKCKKLQAALETPIDTLAGIALAVSHLYSDVRSHLYRIASAKPCIVILGPPSCRLQSDCRNGTVQRLSGSQGRWNRH